MTKQHFNMEEPRSMTAVSVSNGDQVFDWEEFVRGFAKRPHNPHK